MMLEGSNSSSAISWVREDLDECLQNVRDNLEAFAEDTSLREPLLAVQEELERLNLTFMTMRQMGAGILTDEMIAVGGHMLHNGNADCADSLNALTDAVIVLPSYLDRLQAGHEDLPILLLPTLNELRATYDESLLSERHALELAHPPAACGIYNIKIMKCGGITPALSIAGIAATAGCEVMWGCNDESDISIAAALHAAYASPATRYIDLDGSFDLARDVAEGGFEVRDGRLWTTDAPGLGV